MVLIVIGVGSITALYTMVGGIKAVIWTDTMQLGIYLGAIVLVLSVICRSVDGGMAGVLSLASEHGRLSFFNFSTDLPEPYTFWSGLFGGGRCLRSVNLAPIKRKFSASLPRRTFASPTSP